VNILDEDISAIECKRLRARRVHFRQIGIAIGRLGMKDRNDIIPLLHTLRHSTFFTRDHGFYHPGLRHPAYCLVYLDVAFDEIAEFIRRFLRHPAFRTRAQRMGRIVRVHSGGVIYWQAKVNKAQAVNW